MKKDGKYRYSLQFDMNSEENIRVGEVLESLGNKKSAVIVTAMNEYLLKHPNLISSKCQIKLQRSGIDQKKLEEMVRKMVEEHFTNNNVVRHESKVQEPDVQSVRDDIVDMLNDLELFGM